MKDEEWLRKSFMVPSYTFNNMDAVRRELTEAQYKFTDTTLGGNFAINPPPQFTRNADLRVPSRFSNSSGQGRYYSEALDDRGQYVHMRFGVPQYNSLTNFFFNFYNAGAASLANRGRSPGAFYYLGRAVGFVVSLPAQPFIWAGSVIRFLINKPVSKFYYLKPTMPLYWSAVSNMVNAIGVNMGVIGRGMSEGDQILRPDDPNQPGEHSALHDSLAGGEFPNIYRPDGGVDIYKVATRAQRMARVQRKAINKAIENGGSWGTLNQGMEAAITSPVIEPSMNNPDLESYLKKYHDAVSNQVEDDPQESTDHERSSNSDTPEDTVVHSKLGEDDGFGSHLMAELEDGSAFVTFRVDDQGSVSESFQNSAGESQIASTINGISSTARSARFSFADGNTGIAPVDGAINAVRDVVGGFMDEIKISGLMALGGSAFADIPKVWESSTANLPSASYTIELRSPYGTPMARFQNLIVPLSMLLAGVMPISTGKQSYTQPFLCEMFSQGRQQIRLGMIESMSITRGTGNLGWTRNGEPLGIDVSFTVMDMSSLMHMPITANYGVIGASLMGGVSTAGAAVDTLAGTIGGDTNVQAGMENFATLFDKSTYDDDNAFTDYMAVLGSLGLADQIYPTNKLRLRRAQRLANWQQWKSPAHHANWLGGTLPGRLATMLTHQGTPPN